MIVKDGTRVSIKGQDDLQQAGDWGIVTMFDGDDYHVAMMGDLNTQCVFTRNEFTVKRVK
jgi:hypothetical protein